jgi:nucleoid DNA-binding protein
MRMVMLTTLVLTLVGYLSVGTFLGYKAYRGPAAYSTKDFLVHGRHRSTRTLVVNAGDSLTQGTFSADYVGLLRRHLNSTGFEFVNAGVNGAKLAGLLKRTREILACRPDAITILIGTNDVHAYLDSQTKHSPVSLSDSIARFRRDLQSLIPALRSVSTPRIAVFSIPPIGQDMLSPANRAVEQYNEAIRQVCERNHVLKQALQRGEKIDLRGLGVFKVRETKPRQARNPRTGETLSIAAKRTAVFKPGKELSTTLNDRAAQPDGGAAQLEESI